MKQAYAYLIDMSRKWRPSAVQAKGQRHKAQGQKASCGVEAQKVLSGHGSGALEGL
jgi:hypothetical protein